MAKSSSLLGHVLLLIGLSCFFNTGMSMLRCKFVDLFSESYWKYDI